ncbi:hypothetical protein DSM107010_01470 [Chroococcidiopsis cubana SAG 39.79]|uniref:Uncharacterized protein n=1 Tax=Chroococcidiopsis cubana SAG 39.79 TaxID=388085 RepID=A0AB37UTD3_9CYAN|nr:hypothetical protein DSM107010_01470 [Chroococcidiopsis cubana SAG 39.79]
MRLVAPLEEDLRLAEVVVEDLRFVVGWAVGSGSGWGDRSSGMGAVVWGDASGCDFCFVVVLVAVLPFLAGFEVLAVVLPGEADLVVAAGSTVVTSASVLGWVDGWLVCFGVALDFGVAATFGCFLAWRCVVDLTEDARFCVVESEDLLFGFDALDRLLDDGIWGSDT